MSASCVESDATWRSGERCLEGIIDQYLTSVKPMHNRYAEPTKALADILTNGEPSDAVFDLISMKIDGMLSHAAEN